MLHIPGRSYSSGNSIKSVAKEARSVFTKRLFVKSSRNINVFAGVYREGHGLISVFVKWDVSEAA